MLHKARSSTIGGFGIGLLWLVVAALSGDIDEFLDESLAPVRGCSMRLSW